MQLEIINSCQKNGYLRTFLNMTVSCYTVTSTKQSHFEYIFPIFGFNMILSTVLPSAQSIIAFGKFTPAS